MDDGCSMTSTYVNTFMTRRMRGEENNWVTCHMMWKYSKFPEPLYLWGSSIKSHQVRNKDRYLLNKHTMVLLASWALTLRKLSVAKMADNMKTEWTQSWGYLFAWWWIIKVRCGVGVVVLVQCNKHRAHAHLSMASAWGRWVSTQRLERHATVMLRCFFNTVRGKTKAGYTK